MLAALPAQALADPLDGDDGAPPAQAEEQDGGGALRASGATPRIVPEYMLVRDLVSGSEPHLPDAVKSQLGPGQFEASYKLCIGINGTVTSATPLYGVEGADDAIVKTLLGWRFRPQSAPLCYAQLFEFDIPNVMTVREQRIRLGDEPYLPNPLRGRKHHSALSGTYQICVAPSGEVRSVKVVSSIDGADDQIVSTLYRWRYRAQRSERCFDQVLRFEAK